MWLIFVFICVLSGNLFHILPRVFGAQDDSPSKKEHSVISLKRFASAPVIDGRLDDEVWKSAGLLNGFLQTTPGDNTPATHPTEVRIGFDSKELYIAIHAFDENGKVRATVAKRDDITSNDYVAVWLDTFDDRNRAYVLLFNPLGIQSDAVFTEGRPLDYSVDILMQSKGVVTSDGYTIEAAIPFSSLRYRVGKDDQWGVHILRKVTHLDEWDTWMPLRRESRDFTNATFTRFLEQEGAIKGIEGIDEGRTLELIPTVTVSETGERRPGPAPGGPSAGIDHFTNLPVSGEFGLTGKLTLGNGITISGAYNPDFAQIEADQLVVTANQRFPLFFEEKRPFFLEGNDIFVTPIRTLHTRTIIDPDYAFKLSGKRGKNSFGVMVASDDAPGNFTDDERRDPANFRFVEKNSFAGVARLKRDFKDGSTLGAIATSYDFVDVHNRLFGVDGRKYLDGKTILTFQVNGSNSRRNFYDPVLDRAVYRTGNGIAYYLRLERNTKHLNLSLTGRGYSKNYRADLGFVSQTNTNPWDIVATYNSTPRSDGFLISWSVENANRAQFDFSGRMQYSFEAFRTRFKFKKQTWFNTDVYTDYQRVFETEFGAQRTETHPGAFLEASERSTLYKGFTLSGGSAPSKQISFDISFDESWKAFDFDLGAGPKFPRVSPAALLDPNAPLDPGTGKSLDITANLKWRPTDKITAALGYIKSKLFRRDTERVAYDQNIISTRFTYQYSRNIFARVRLDHDSLQSRLYGQFLAGWTPNPGTAVYIGYNDDLNYNGYNPFSGLYERGLQRNTRSFFIKLSYLFRKSI